MKNIVMILIVLSLSMTGISFADAQKSSIAPSDELSLNGEQIEYDISILLNRIGQIDKAVGTYDLDFWVSVKSDKVDFLVNPPRLDFVNGRIDEMSSEFVTSNYYEVFVQGKFYNQMDYHDFPFEKLLLNVEIEPSAPNTAKHVVLRVDDISGIDSKAKIPGWLVSEKSFHVETHSYSQQGDFSRFIASYVAERSELGSFLKTIFPVLIITGLSLYSFWVPENFTLRIYLVMPTLVALVFWHINTLNSLPTLGYFTIFDKVMISAYAVYINSVTSIVIQTRLAQSQQHEKIKKANNVMRYLIPVIGIGVFLTSMSL